jgi:integrase
MGKLTALAVTRATTGMHADGGGLYLQVRGQAKSWVYRYGLGGRERYFGLGSLTAIPLKKARELHAAARQLRAQGFDPIQHRKAQRAAARVESAKALSFDQCATAYIATHESGWRNRAHHRQWTNTLATYASPVIGKLPVSAIDRGLVIKVLEPIWASKLETARRVRARIENVLDFAEARGYRPQGTNPARLLPIKTALGARKQQAKHLDAMPFDQVGEFMAALRGRDGAPERALEFLIFTSTRSGEMRGARWAEINFKDRTWTIPAERTKGLREHRVPLSDAAIAVLERMDRQSELIFSQVSRNALVNLLRQMGQQSATAHGFRSSFRDWAAETTSYPNHVVEMALAHAVSNAVEAAYRRGDLFEKRRRLMDEWGRFCSKPASAADNVLPLRTTV